MAKKWKAKIDHVDWRWEPDLNDATVKGLYKQYHNKVIEVICGEDEIEDALREVIRSECSFTPDEVEFTYR